MANEARNRLRSMGGIMASSPELLQAQQGYQDGGTVSPTVPVVGGLDTTDDARAARSFGRTPYLDGLVDAPNLNPNPVAVGSAPLTPRGQESEQFRRGVLDDIRLTSDAILQGVELPPSYGVGGASGLLGGAFDVAGGAASLVGADRVSASLEGWSDQLYNQARALFEDGIFSLDQIDQEDLNLEPEEFGPVLEQARQDAAAEEDAQTRMRAQEELQRSMPGGMRIGEEDPKIVADTKMEESKSDRAEAQRRLQQTRPEELLTMGGKLASAEELAPPPDPDDNTPKAKRTLRDRYEKRMELFKDIFGESDEARARDRAMSLAMMGLAIASGQSPNALTNIAQGAAAGLQGMSEQEQARREQERGLKTLALESVLDDLSAEKEAAAQAEERVFDRQTELLVEDAKNSSGVSSALDRLGAGRMYEDALERAGNEYNEGVISVPEGVEPAAVIADRVNALMRRRIQLGIADNQMNPETGRRILEVLGAGAATSSPSTIDSRVQDWITQRREQNVSDERIRELLERRGHTPEDYGL
jgi:hypothetical protein